MSYRILSQDCLADNNSHATGLNNNDLIVGPSGAGKTRGYVLSLPVMERIAPHLIAILKRLSYVSISKIFEKFFGQHQ